MAEVVPGGLAYSKTGRDKGVLFVVVTIEDGFCGLSDGRTRTVAKLKKKNVKHCMPVNYIDEEVADIVSSRGAAALDDVVIRAVIKRYQAMVASGTGNGNGKEGA